MKFSLFLLISLLLVNVSFQNSVQCDGETIDKCTACNTGENSDTCSACEDGTFLFFHNLVCLPCNNSIYGQPGCGGKCNGTNFTEYRKISCEEGGCIEGYYRSYDGICYPCNYSSPHCSKCSYYRNETHSEFKCLECESDDFIFDQYGRCNNCTMDNCEKCKFNENRTKTICEQCKDGFSINKNGQCDQCYNETGYYNKICYECNNDREPIQCWCLEGYYENPENPLDCLSCPKGCPNCTLNKETNKAECSQCEENFILNSKKECIECPYVCGSCEIDENDKAKCSSCKIGYSFSKDNNCESCGGSYCASCELDEYNNPIKCLSCFEGYVLNPQNSCLACNSFGGYEGYEQCSSCIPNEEIKDEEDYICTGCNPGYALYQKSCIKCEEGCELCEYDEKGNNLCTKCSHGYALNSDKKCVQCEEGCSSCEFDEKGNSICLKCNDYSGHEYVLSLNKTCLKCDPLCDYRSCKLDNDTNKPICSDCAWGSTNYNGQCFKCQEGCSSCKIDESSVNKNKTICEFCLSEFGFGLNTDEHQCYKCESLEETGEGCNSCNYNAISKKFECTRCKSSYNDITYKLINNLHQCINITKLNLMELEVCPEINYNEETKEYECSKCQEDNLILVSNEKRCKYYSDLGLSSGCLEAESIKSKDSTIYSCLSCRSNYLNLSLGSTSQIDCFYPNGNFSLCSEGTVDENKENQVCTKCIKNAELNNTTNICTCTFDSFLKNEKCYKCDDPVNGYIGCLASKGCDYLTYHNLHCNECKEGYYNNSYNVCFPCSDIIPNCGKCHSFITIGEYNETITNVTCDSCTPLYTLKTENEKQECELNECEEYPEISPGCIICKDKLDEYKPNNKCQTCKYGYFLTKEEKCVYCRSEEYGGPACYECGYDQDEEGKDTDNIICKNCYSYFNYHSLSNEYNNDNEEPYCTSILSSKKKCYNCQYELSDLCLSCEFVSDEELKCNLCPPGYYIDSEGNCISFAEQVEVTPNCSRSRFTIGNYTFRKSSSIDLSNNIEYVNLSDYNKALSNAKYPISSNCTSCIYNFVLNNKDECDPINYDVCTGKYILEDISHRLNPCEYSCDYRYEIYIKLEDNTRNMDLNPDNYKNISNEYLDSNIINIYYLLLNYFNDANKETQEFLLNTHLCLDSEDENTWIQFSGCSQILYNPTDKSYICLFCSYSYYMDPKSNKCIYNRTTTPVINNTNCEYENIGTNATPIYSCIRCYNELDTLITNQNGTKTCEYIYEIEDCAEANVTSTYYIDTIYNCTSCKYYYWPYYSKYYDRQICQHIFYDIIKSDELILEDYDKEEDEILSAKNGICESGYFTPDGKDCYKCDSEEVGMPGCNGACSFSLNRSENLLCEAECKEGYIERSKGVCVSCNKTERGCISCHYENTYPEDYLGVKRERYVKCDKCDKGYDQDEAGNCHSCGSHCEECFKNETFIEELNDTFTQYICTKCEKHYFLNKEYNDCESCFAVKAETKNSCPYCDEVISNCRFCESKEGEDGLKCKECDGDYILDSDSNTCLKRTENKDLDKFKNCLEYHKENGKEVCVRCKPQFSLMKEGDEVKCAYLPTLFDAHFREYYLDINRKDIYHIEKVFKNDYYSRQGQFMPCKEAVNIGTEENPSYSCSKCYDVFGDEDSKFYSYYYDDFYYTHEYYYSFDSDNKYLGYMPVKINDKMTKTSYCMRYVNETENCAEADYKIIDGKEVFNCTKCLNNYVLTYKKRKDIFVCILDKKSTNDNGSKTNHTESDTKSDASTPEPGAVGSDTKPDTKTDGAAINSDNPHTETNGTDPTSPNTNLAEDPYVDPNAGECFVESCQTCLSSRSYYCSVCDNNYEVNAASGSCVEKTAIPPAISFVDIFGFIRKASKTIGGRTYTGPSFKLRGITCSEIKPRHAFAVILIFILQGRVRNLDDNTLKIPCICEVQKAVSESENSINNVDYDCIGRQEVGDKYKLVGIEGDNINIDLLENAGDPEKPGSTFSEDIALFTIDDVTNITSNNNKFEFDFDGTLVDKSNKLSNTKNIPIEMKDRTEKTFCDFTKSSNEKANLDCTLSLTSTNIKKNLFSLLSRKDSNGITDLTFKDNLIKINNNNVYINKLNEVHLIQDPNYNPESNIAHKYSKNSSSSHKALIISLSVVLGVIVIGAIIALSFYLVKVRNTSKTTNPDGTVNSMTIDNMVNNYSANDNK